MLFTDLHHTEIILKLNKNIDVVIILEEFVE
jgi:hypothetical protein